MRKSNKQEFIQKAKEVHGDKYDYSKVEYINTKTKVCIGCSIHGEFWQRPHDHLKGVGCPKCGIQKVTKALTCKTEKFIEKAKQVHGDEYDYSETEYGLNNKEKVSIICKKHGRFLQSPNSHLKGRGCPLCYGNIRYTTENFIKQATEIHNNTYDYSNVKYKNNKTKVCIICPEHGEFWQTPHNHLIGQGCPKCSPNYKMTNVDFIIKSNIIHNNKYNYISSTFVNGMNGVDIICPIHGVFTQNAHDHLQGCGCPKCAVWLSKGEEEIYEFCNSICNDTVQRDRTVLKPKELDIYIPSKHLAIEYNGLVWHSEQFKEYAENYHLEKTNLCNEKGIRLIHIFEDEWLYKKDIVKSLINENLNKIENTILPNNFKIKKIHIKTANKFLKENYIIEDSVGKYNIGLYIKGELLCIMSFDIYEDENYLLKAYCNKLNTNVIDGGKKILDFFINSFKPRQIIYYSDKRFNNERIAEELSFNYIKDVKPSYYYVSGQHRYKSEMFNDKYKIYDCGYKLFEMNLNN